MAEMHETPSANRLRIAFFGPRNAGKSTLVNAFTGQDVAIVSDVPGQNISEGNECLCR